jgi:hypothetical protein
VPGCRGGLFASTPLLGRDMQGSMKTMSLHLSRMIQLILIAAPGSLLFGQAVSFLAPVNTSVGAGLPPLSAAMTIADFNGDGKPDIAFSVPDAKILLPGAVLFGNGDGTFRPGPAIPGGKPWIGDVNGDGKPDLVIAGAGVSIVLSNGDGTFQAPVQVAACTEFAAVADLNADKKVDLVCGTTVLLGNGDGTFRTGVTVDAGQGDFVVLAADFNHDSNPDLLLGRQSLKVAVVLGNGDGTFGADLPATTLPSLFLDVVVGDFNGDGKLDLAGDATRAGLICVAFGNGDGTFGKVVINQGLPGSPVAAGDFNGDGKLDLVAGAGMGDMVLAGNGDGTFRVPVFIPIFIGTVAIADFNGDGLPDIAEPVASLSSGVAVLLNDSPGDGFLTAGVSSATAEVADRTGIDCECVWNEPRAADSGGFGKCVSHNARRDSGTCAGLDGRYAGSAVVRFADAD